MSLLRGGRPLGRPRPKSLLDQKTKKQVIKNLRKYERKFAAEDKKKDVLAQREATTEKRDQRRAFRELWAERAKTYEANAAARMAMRNGFDADADELYIITKRTVESVVKSKEEIMD